MKNLNKIMILYILIFSIPTIYFLIGKKQSDKNDIFLPLYMLSLAWFVGLSDMLGGYDRYIYGDIFDSIADGVSMSVPPTRMYAFGFFEWGYSFFNWIIAHFTANRYIFILVLTLVMYTNFYIAFKRHIKNYPFAFIIFFGLLFFFTFTYLRQTLGLSFAFLSIKPLKEKKYLQFIIIMAIVFLMHKSGVIFAWMALVPRIRLSKEIVIISLLVCLAIGASGIISSSIDAYEAAMMKSTGGNYAADAGFRVPYILEAALFVSIILFNYDKIAETEDNMLFLNMALMFCAVLLLFVRSENGGRMSWYFIFGIIVTFTNIISHPDFGVFSKLSLATVFFGLYLRIVIEWGIYLYPYKTFLTNGIREGDHFAVKYEYDNRYVTNKMYREPFRYMKEWKYSE